MRNCTRLNFLRGLVLCLGSLAASLAGAQAARQFSFAYDQPPTTAYGIAGNIFDAKLKELSGGKMSINQFPGAQLGQEPQMLQKMRAGDIDFVITSTANASTLAPQAGVFSLHFMFRDQAHLQKALADPAIAAEFRAMVKDQVQGAQVLGLMTMGMRNMYSKQEVKSIDDIKGKKVRVQATKTEDTHFPAYGAQTVHMPFGDVYTSLQTGVVNVAENGINVYLANKHYEVAPVLSITEHEANNNCIWVSDKTWNSLSPGAAELGPGGRRRGVADRAGAGAQAREGFGDQAQDDRRQGRRQRRQERLHEGGDAGAGPARRRARPARGQAAQAGARPEVARGLAAAHPAATSCIDDGEPRMADFRALILQRHRQLKWKAFDRLEAVLMILCGVCITMFTLTVFLDVVTRTLGAPWLWLQQVTTAFFAWGVFVGMAAATRRNDHFYLTEITKRMTGAPRTTIEITNRIIVLVVAVLLVWCGTQNALLDLGSYRMPSLIPLTVYTAIVPIAGVLIFCSRSSSSSTAGSNGFEGPEDRDDTREPLA